MSTDHAQSEYEALRATIRERGTWRVVLFWLSLAVWASLLVTAVARGTPFLLLVSLVELAAGFEGVYALHVGVERIGRYLQVFYETSAPGSPARGPSAAATPGTPAWERTAMAYGREPTGAGLDPIFSTLFATAVLLNLVPMLASRQSGLILTGVAAHAVFVARILQARRYAARQRATDLEKFKNLLAVRNEERETRNE